jgi:hypothetical protein
LLLHTPQQHPRCVDRPMDVTLALCGVRWCMRDWGHVPVCLLVLACPG